MGSFPSLFSPPGDRLRWTSEIAWFEVQPTSFLRLDIARSKILEVSTKIVYISQVYAEVHFIRTSTRSCGVCENIDV